MWILEPSTESLRPGLLLHSASIGKKVKEYSSRSEMEDLSLSTYISWIFKSGSIVFPAK